MCGDHLRRITAEKHLIELTNEYFRPVHRASHKTGPTARQLMVAEIDRMRHEEAIETALTE